MTSAVDRALTLSLAAVRRVNGSTIVFHRGGLSVELEAIKGRQQERSLDGTIVVAEADLTDWIFPIADLASLSPSEPQRTDWIEFNGRRHDVAERGGQGYWSWATPDQTWIRVHTVDVGTS